MSQEQRDSVENREEARSDNSQTPQTTRLPYGNPVTLPLRSATDVPSSNHSFDMYPSRNYIQDTSSAAARQARFVLESIDPAVEDEDRDLQQAITNSINDAQSPSQPEPVIGQYDTPKRKDRCSPPSPRSPLSPSYDESPSKRSKSTPTWSKLALDMNAMMKNAEKVYRSSLPFLQDDAPDTYVFLTQPARQPENDRNNYKSMMEHYSRPLCVRREILDSLNSSEISDMFGPTAQFRVLRRLHLVNKLPSHIKYAIDLTPPTEGDEAIELVAALCCSPTIREWFKAADRWGVSWGLVGGPDDFAIPYENMYSDGQVTVATNEEATKGGENSKEGNKAQNKPKPREDPSYPEYSPVRHTSCIERVLIAAYGIDPKLDSAPKVWTTVMVAKHMGGKHRLLTDWVIRWLRAPPNSCFLEVLPEASLQIADALENLTLCQDTFSILVGEEALASICQGRPVQGFDHSHTVFGRKKFDIPETYQTRIEYASKQFKDRISGKFEALAGNEMKWVEELPELKNLLDDRFITSACGQALGDLTDMLKKFIRGAIYFVLVSNYHELPGPVQGVRSGGESLFPTTSLPATWSQLHYKARIFTRPFWKILGLILLNEANSDQRFASNYSISLPPPYRSVGNWNNELSVLDACGTIKWVQVTHLYNRIRNCFEKCNGSVAPVHSFPICDGALNGVEAGSSEQTGKIQSLTNNTGNAYPSTHTDALGNTDFLLPLRFRPSQSSEYEPTPLPTQAQENDQNAENGTHWGDLMTTKQATMKDFFSLPAFFEQVEQCFENLSKMMLEGTSSDFDLQLTNTLVCLDEEEKKYLPLWAEGLDDGSGGVYNDDLPTAEMGFTAPGPTVHTGVGSSAVSSTSEFEMMDRSDAGSISRNTSTVVNDGTSDNLDRHRVYDADSVVGSGSEWEVMTADGVEGGYLLLDKGKGKMVERPAEPEIEYQYEDGEEPEFEEEMQEDEEEEEDKEEMGSPEGFFDEGGEMM